MKRQRSHQWRLILAFLVAAVFTQACMPGAMPETIAGTVAEISGNEILMQPAGGQPIRRVTVTSQTLITVESGATAPLSLIGAGSNIEVKMNAVNRSAFSILVKFDPGLAGAIRHEITGREDCLLCHKPDGVKPFPKDHAGRTNETCMFCHPPAASVSLIPHSIEKELDCLSCHGEDAIRPFSASHKGRTDETCLRCHVSAPIQTVSIPHLITTNTDCLTCHGPGGVRLFPANHAGRTNNTCILCHQSVPVNATRIPHLINGFINCQSCHEPGGIFPFPSDHAGRTNITCDMCHVPLPFVAASIPHDTAGISDCLKCHGLSAPEAFPATHAGRTSNTCVLCHKSSLVKATFIPHSTAGTTDCLECHGTSGISPYTASHIGRPGDSCLLCHDSSLLPAVSIPHSISGNPNCISCHNDGGIIPFSSNHAGRTNDTCSLCHQSAPVFAPRVSHSVYEMSTCLTCHHEGGTAPFPSDHARRTGITCTLCHSFAPTIQIPVSHPVAGNENCLVCHSSTGVWPNPPSHEGRTNATCFVCHNVGAMGYSSAISHEIVDLSNCLLCHSVGSVKPFTADHVGRAVTSCTTCHPATGNPAPNITHTLSNRADCRACHDSGEILPFPVNHVTRPNTECVLCHTPSRPAILISHSVIGRDDCLACHKIGGVRPFTADHVGRPNLTCTICHQTTPGNPLPTPTPTPTPLPAAPSSLAATAVSASQVDLTWTDNSINETDFRIQRATNSGFTSGLATFTVGEGMTNYSDTSVAASRTYYYRVMATNSAGDSGPSNTVNVSTPAAITIPAAPTNLIGAVISANQVDLTWTDNSASESGYRIERALNSGFSTNLNEFTVGNDATSFSDTTVQPATTYFYRVTAFNSAGDSTASNTRTVSTPALVTVPAAPSGLAASAPSPNRVELTWTDNSNNEDGFRIQRASNSGFTSGLTTFSVAANAVSYSDTSVAASSTYYFRVMAFNSAGDSSPSNTRSVLTPAPVTIPVAPTNLVATAVSSGQVNLSWTDNSNNEAGFHVSRATNSGFTAGLTTFTVSVGITTYSDASVAPGTTYYYRVTAYNSAGDSNPTSTRTVLTPAAGTIPVSPSSLTAMAVNATQVNLAWTDNSNNEAGFHIQRATNSGFTAGLTTFTAGAGSVTYGDTSVLAATIYYYRVIAFNNIGESAVSNTATITTPAVVPLPAAPTALTVTATSATQVNLSWTDNSNNESGFHIQRATDNGFITGLTTFNAGATVTTYSDTSVVASTTYYYRVTAYNTSGDSAVSNTVTVTTPGLVLIPAAPTGLTASAVSATQVSLTWADTSNNESGFRIQRATNSGFSTGLTTFTVGANAGTYSDTSAVAGTTYYYRVTAYNTAGESLPTNTATVTTPASVTIPAAPTALSATAASSTQINLSWTDSSNNESGFRIQRASNSGFTTGLATFTVGANITTYSDTSVVAGTAYYYRVMAYNGAGDSSPSNAVTITTPAAIDAAALYASACARCHGANRTGGSGPNITMNSSIITGYTEASLVTWISGHYGGSFTAAQRTALAHWLKVTP